MKKGKTFSGSSSFNATGWLPPVQEELEDDTQGKSEKEEHKKEAETGKIRMTGRSEPPAQTEIGGIRLESKRERRGGTKNLRSERGGQKRKLCGTDRTTREGHKYAEGEGDGRELFGVTPSEALDSANSGG